jgi:hypothetical protein
MYRVPPPKEPSGCLQALVITRILLQILLVPFILLLGALVTIALAIVAFVEHPLLGFAVIAIALLILVGLAKWEYARVAKERQPFDDE